MIGTKLFGRDVNVFHHWLAPAVAGAHGGAEAAGHGASLELALMGLALAIALSGIGFAWVGLPEA